MLIQQFNANRPVCMVIEGSMKAETSPQTLGIFSFLYEQLLTEL